jgi:hypothetical protein
MRDGLLNLPSLGQAAGVEHVTNSLRFVTLLHIFSVTWFESPVNPQNLSISTYFRGSVP